MKTYGGGTSAYLRPIVKPVAGSVKVAVNGIAKTVGSQVTVDTATGVITFTAGNSPPIGAAVTAGFLFDVPVRFDADRLDIDLSAFGRAKFPTFRSSKSGPEVTMTELPQASQAILRADQPRFAPAGG